ncbi:MAG: hypothetical protein JJLCMIEE_01196 [Acidimicrobiales bacterium]|nr:MAG: sulfur carrier protein ThiS [Actinomycetota bacterium]MBV6508136.1 hypothetical protein [Acidimicrobiales bacterium]RIK03881.1 MAG: thiamine biosynthesis protein ThiS [Acidobacteriota bacterium]
MKVFVNGDLHERSEAETVEMLVDAVTDSPRGIAVAVNGEVVPRSEWGDTTLLEHDRVEVLGASQGG